MRLILLALLVSVGRLAAQDPSPAILRAAATDSADKLYTLRIAGDTAWAAIVNTHDREVAGGLFPGREVRLQRRAGNWTVLATRPIVVPLAPFPRRPAKPFSFADTAKRP